MIFSDLYKSPRSPFSKLRSAHHPPPPSDIDADLISKDKTKQKEAVKRFLAERVRDDWEFTWPPVSTPAPPASPPTPAQSEQSSVVDGDAPLPPATGPTPTSAEHVSAGGETVAAPTTTATEANEDEIDDDDDDDDDGVNRDSGEEPDLESDAGSVYSTISEDPTHFQPRAEWTSDLSDDDGLQPVPSPFRFHSPDHVGTVVRESLEDKRTRRRRALREEVSWNPGLACFEARRDAWTGARTVRVKPKPIPPTSPSTGRRLSFWRLHRTESGSSHHSATFAPSSPPSHNPLENRNSHQTDISTITPPLSESNSAKGVAVQRSSSHESTSPPVLYPVETVIPVPVPLLPPQNPMRASITPSMYPSLYDKLVVQGLQPACPVNLSDMIRACVVGWKRDGEWPPRSTYTAPFPVPVATTTAELVALRQRKAAQQQKRNASRQQGKAGVSTSPPVTSPGPGSAVRRMSLGFLGKGSAHEDKDHSHSDEAKGFRKSLQRVLSLGHHSHHSSGSNGLVSPTGTGKDRGEVIGAALGAAMT